jgi:hypothetical protein
MAERGPVGEAGGERADEPIDVKKPPEGRPAAVEAQPAKPEAVSRKIIYTTSIEVVVEDFDAAERELLQLLKAQDGAYIAKSDVRGSPGTPRSGSWTIRVPVSGFEAFKQAVAHLGELQRNQTDSQDVTDEYYDLGARIKNKQVEEERLLKHLEKSTGKLEDILAVEKELTRVRGEIERYQGRRQYLEKLSALTTVTVTIHERKNYGPDKTQAPTFGTTVSRTFEGSLDVLASFGKGLVLFVVALLPWLVVLAVLAVPAVLLWRRQRRQIAIIQPVTGTPLETP